MGETGPATPGPDASAASDPGRPSALRRFGLPLALFAATVVTTTLAIGPAFSVTLLSILVAHEMGHFVVARSYGIQASPPHFIPLPPLGVFHLGTLGAVIMMRTDQADRDQLLQIGAAGPIAGFVVAVPAMVLGLAWSTPVPFASMEGPVLFFGDSLLSWGLEKLVVPDLPADLELEAHPVFLGAWAGFLVTAINLMPMGQLDGGHILHALDPKRSAARMQWTFVTLMALGVFGLLVHLPTMLGTEWQLPQLTALRPWFTAGFIVWALFGRFTGLVHPPVQAEDRPLSPFSRSLAALAAVVLLLTFMPNPAWVDGMEP